MSRNISHEEQRQAVGHSTTKSIDLYTRMNLNLGIPSSLELSMWPDIRKIPQPPSIDILYLTEEEIETLLDHIYFYISLPIFKRDGCMRVFLRRCTAALIIYYSMFVNDHDIKNISQRLIEAVVNSNLASDATDSSKKFVEWSQMIVDDFMNNNSTVETNKATIKNLLAVNNAQNAKISVGLQLNFFIVELCGVCTYIKKLYHLGQLYRSKRYNTYYDIK